MFDVNKLGDKKVKTKTSPRLVPIHPFLMNELNILKLKRKLLKEGHDRLFPEITPARDGYGAPVSKWYNQRFKHKIELEPDPEDRWKDLMLCRRHALRRNRGTRRHNGSRMRTKPGCRCKDFSLVDWKPVRRWTQTRPLALNIVQLARLAIAVRHHYQTHASV